jgi:hypothetical protein
MRYTQLPLGFKGFIFTKFCLYSIQVLSKLVKDTAIMSVVYNLSCRSLKTIIMAEISIVISLWSMKLCAILVVDKFLHFVTDNRPEAL